MQAHVALVIIIALAFSIASPINENDQFKRLMVLNTQLKDLNKQFLCGPPQPRAIPLENLMKKLPNFECETIEPHAVVLHRCDCEAAGFCERNKESEAGFCQDKKKSCQPIAREEVELIFKKIEIKKASCIYNERPKIRFIRVTAVNHTKCECHRNENYPK